jgi:hypothetical protein
MISVASGKERSIDEYAGLLEKSGWKYVQTHHPNQQNELIQVIEGLNFSDPIQLNHEMSSYPYIQHLLSSESLKISHHAKCRSNFCHKRDGKAPC